MIGRSPNKGKTAAGTSGRIRRLQTELAGVTTGAHETAPKLPRLNDGAVRNQESSTRPVLSTNTMSGRSTERQLGANFAATSLPTTSEAFPCLNDHSCNFLEAGHPSIPGTINGGPVQHDAMLRARQRAYLDHLRQASGSNSNLRYTATSNTHRTRMRENPFHSSAARSDADLPAYQRPVGTGIYGNIWWQHPEVAPFVEPSQVRGADPISTAPSGTVSAALPNPLVNPPILSPVTPGHLTSVHSHHNEPQPLFMHYAPFGASDLNLAVEQPPPSSTRLPSFRRTFHSTSPTARSRRLQNLAVPQRSAGHSETLNTAARTPQPSSRRTSHIGSEGRTTEPSELEESRSPLSRLPQPLIFPGGVSRDQYLTEVEQVTNGAESEPESAVTFDTQERPPPMDPEAMVLDMACSICREHVVDTVVVPCGHAVMCNWCADLQVPSRRYERGINIPRDKAAKCPICRARIKQKVKY